MPESPRRCKCGTILSRFNPDKTCWYCTPPDRKLMQLQGQSYSEEVRKIREAEEGSELHA